MLMEKEVEKLDRMVVYAKGGMVPDDIEEGDEVLVDRRAVANAPVVKLTDKLSVLCITSFDIYHVWL